MKQKTIIFAFFAVTVFLITLAFAIKKPTNVKYMQSENVNVNYAQAVFGGGCFWCTEAIFLKLKGVVKVEPGYSGGTTKKPTYKEVCTGRTGHAEAIRITYDPKVITYPELLEVFFATHDPTQLNRQGNDIGTQYRSVVFYRNDGELIATKKIIAKLEAEQVYPDKIVTSLEALDSFYPAEVYHFNYYNQNQNQPYCAAVITPKVEKFEKKFATKIKPLEH